MGKKTDKVASYFIVVGSAVFAFFGLMDMAIYLMMIVLSIQVWDYGQK